MKQLVDYNNKIRQIATLFNMFNPYLYYDEEDVFMLNKYKSTIAKPFRAFEDSKKKLKKGFYIDLFYIENFRF